LFIWFVSFFIISLRILKEISSYWVKSTTDGYSQRRRESFGISFLATIHRWYIWLHTQKEKKGVARRKGQRLCFFLFFLIYSKYSTIRTRRLALNLAKEREEEGGLSKSVSIILSSLKKMWAENLHRL
jgi:hypothetical protein